MLKKDVDAMNITDSRIDGGKAFDWGRTSSDYARFRDIYPPEFYRKIISLGLCVDGQRVLDVGTGTGVLPRNLYNFGARWTGVDISAEQIEQAKRLSDGKNIVYEVSSAEDIRFPDNSFDVITSCQCFWYFKHEFTSRLFSNLLKPDGRFVVLSMDWLPFEDKTAGASEALVLKYSPDWSGAGETLHELEIPNCYSEYFDIEYKEAFPLTVHFTREGWNGRMKSCRGIGASLSEDEIRAWEAEHMKLLNEIAPPEFDVAHYATVTVMRVKK